MISAGQTYPQQMIGQNPNMGYAGMGYGNMGYGGMGYGGMGYGNMGYGAPSMGMGMGGMGNAPSMPQWNMPMPTISSGGGINMTCKTDLNSDQAGKIAEAQLASQNKAMNWNGAIACISGGGGLLNQLGQCLLNSKYLSNQNNYINKMSELQMNIVNGQREVANRQFNLQEKTIDAQKVMLRDQQSHEYRMAQLQGTVQSRLASIDQSGRTERAKIMAVSDPFSNRGRYDSGLPAFSC